MNFFRDEGIVLKKTKLLKQRKLITVFTKDHGKIVLHYYGSQSIKSRRLSHLETLNRIRFSARESKDRISIAETEVIEAYQEIKQDNMLIKLAYEILSILNNLIPENVQEEEIYNRLLRLLQNLSNKTISEFYAQILLTLGFVDYKTINQKFFDVYTTLENVMNRKIMRY